MMAAICREMETANVNSICVDVAMLARAKGESDELARVGWEFLEERDKAQKEARALHEALKRSHELKESLQLQLNDQTKSKESLCLQVEILEREKEEQMMVEESLRLQVAVLEQQKEQVKEEANKLGMELDLEELMGAMEDVPEIPILDDEESEPDDKRKRKRKTVFDVSCSLPSPVRAQSPARSDNAESSNLEATGPGARSSSTAELVPPTSATPISVCTEKPSNSWLLMLNYNILAETDPDQARILMEVACAMADSKRDLIGMRSELVKLRGNLRVAKTEAGKEKEEALKIGEELKAAKEETARALVTKEKAEEALERSHERESSLKSEMEEQLKAVKSFGFLVARLEREKEDAKEVGKEEYLRSVDFRKCVQTEALPVLLAGMKVGIRQAVKKFRHLDSSVVEFAPDLKDSYGVKIGVPLPYSSPKPVTFG